MWGSVKRRAYVCGSCNERFYSDLPAEALFCRGCHEFLCGNCGHEPIQDISLDVCPTIAFDYERQSYASLQSWPHDNIRLRCPHCRIWQQQRFHGAVYVYTYTCRSCVPKDHRDFICHPGTAAVIYNEYGETPEGHTLYTRQYHRTPCINCGFNQCDCARHRCPARNDFRTFHPRVAYAYTQRVRRTAFLLFCVFRGRLHRDTILDQIVRQLN